MEPIISDTTIEADAVQIRVLRKIGIEGRARMTFQLSNNMRRTVEAGVRYRNPEYDDRQVKRWRNMRRHVTQIKNNCEKGDLDCRRKQRQAVLHWAYDSRKL